MKSELELKFVELVRKSVKSKEEVAEMERVGERWAEELNREIQGLIEELKNVGLRVISVWDFVNTAESYPEAIDILIKHLSKQYHRRNKEGIVRALTVKEAKGKANATLLVEYNKIPKDKENDSLRWAFGNAIYFIVTPNDVESILPIVENKENGISRDRFILALGKVKAEKAENVLIKLLDDDEVAPSALQALGRLKSKNAKEKIRLLINTQNALIKKEAQKALKKIG